jgi:hypothetical protein
MHAAQEGNSLSATATPIAIESRILPLTEAVPPPSGDAGEAQSHPLFLRWVLFQSIVLTLLAAGGIAYGGRLHGASLVVVPIILAVLAATSAYAGLLAWRRDRDESARDGIRHLWFAAGACQLVGLLGTVAGFYAMFENGDGSTGAPGSTDLATRVPHGAGIALSATFVGILSSLVILVEHHVLDGDDR